MDPTTTMLKIRNHIDSILTYLRPLLKLANCHMVEFLTDNHWETLLPRGLRETLDAMDMEEAVEKFWSCQNDTNVDSALNMWVRAAQSHCLSVNDECCLSVDQLEQRIKARGGILPPEIPVKQFMNPKKSYEVTFPSMPRCRHIAAVTIGVSTISELDIPLTLMATAAATAFLGNPSITKSDFTFKRAPSFSQNNWVRVMSRLLSSLYHTLDASCSLEAGGGRGHLFVTASRGYHLRCLTVDCDQKNLDSAEERGKLIQKQWHAISNTNKREDPVTEKLHRFARLFVTENTDLVAVVKDSFPEIEDVRILLTGLHTCGNLGPDSLRIFTSQPAVCAVFNVPCCYHLLTEETDGTLFDVFQRHYGDHGTRKGFPMSEHLRGFKLGRNARMLAAQSIERVVAARQLPAHSLLYRAMLQVIIKKYKPELLLAEGRLKRAAKSQDFEQYFKMADKILNLELYGTLPANYLTDVDSQWKNMVMFYLIRLCLAQVIESLILLDRLLFLMENGFSDVYLVKLFDPVLSPRCHSIVAIR